MPQMPGQLGVRLVGRTPWSASCSAAAPPVGFFPRIPYGSSEIHGAEHPYGLPAVWPYHKLLDAYADLMGFGRPSIESCIAILLRCRTKASEESEANPHKHRHKESHRCGFWHRFRRIRRGLDRHVAGKGEAGGARGLG
jgi:hypothetical protein